MINLGEVKRDKASDVLEAAKGHVVECIILGYTPEGDLVSMGSDNITVQKAVYMLESMKLNLIQMGGYPSPKRRA